MINIKFELFALPVLVLLSVSHLSFAEQANPFVNETVDNKDTVGKQNNPRPRVRPDHLAIKIDKPTCLRLQKRRVNHTQRSDVAYVAGKDVRGKKVKSADLNTEQNLDLLGDDISFDLPFDPFGHLGRADLQKYFPDASMSLGTVNFNKISGQITLNGKILNKTTKDAVLNACDTKFPE